MFFNPFKPANWNFRLAEQGVLGINARNLDYIIKNNPRRNYPNVDDKVLTKKLAQAAGVTCPDSYGVIEFQEQVRRFEEIIGDHREFVIKPAQGSGGGGIIVIADRNSRFYMKSSGAPISKDEIQYHLYNILSGLYSLGDSGDKAIIEYRVKTIKLLDEVSFKGVPDIRVISYKGVPVMAMLRVPTKESDGKANLHSGGLGIGISMATGRTTYGIQHGAFIEQHPEISTKLAGLQIPDWKQLLTLAASFNDIVKLGYVGVDIVIDETYGPMLLEVNARPGIAIQVANRSGLQRRLQTIDAHFDELTDLESKVAFSMATFE